ncbi:MAG: hypothetical protein CSA49_02440 [Gammaproteobacteria bacterium]|nr:MAG: hypothetical protein CSA49_02440 [Gammaproteobacteria bacterium]
MSRLPANVSRFTFEIVGLSETFSLLSFAGSESISDIYHYEITLLAESGDLALASMIGRNAVLTLLEPDHPRIIHGVICAAEQLNHGDPFSGYKITLVPKLWWLQHRSGHRIFQKMSIPGIVVKVLEEAGIKGNDILLDLKSGYPARDYCVQYGETELHFIQRLLSDEGINFYFRHSANGHTLVLTDHNGSYQNIPGDTAIRYCQEDRTAKDEPIIYALNAKTRVTSTEACVGDYNPAKPDLRLHSGFNIIVVDNTWHLEDHRYRSQYALTTGDAVRYKNINLQQIQCFKKVVRCSSDDVRLAVGSRFSVKQHPNPSVNRDYLLYRYDISGTQPPSKEALAGASATQYTCISSSIPATVAFKIRSEAVKPRIHGVQTAFVTGPNNNEIYTDDKGRIKVQFHWDREGQYNEQSTAWIRVSQQLAGKEWGSWILPRVGHQNDSKTFVGRDQHQSIASNQFVSVGKHQHQTIGHNHQMEVGQNLAFSVGKDFHLKVSGADVTQVGNQLHIKGGMNTTLQAGALLSLTAGGSFLTLDPAGVSIFGPTVRINEGGGAIPAIPPIPKQPDTPVLPDDDNAGKLEKVPPTEPPYVRSLLAFAEGKAQKITLKMAAKARAPFVDYCTDCALQPLPIADEVRGENQVDVLVHRKLADSLRDTDVDNDPVAQARANSTQNSPEVDPFLEHNTAFPRPNNPAPRSLDTTNDSDFILPSSDQYWDFREQLNIPSVISPDLPLRQITDMPYVSDELFLEFDDTGSVTLGDNVMAPGFVDDRSTVDKLLDYTGSKQLLSDYNYTGNLLNDIPAAILNNTVVPAANAVALPFLIADDAALALDEQRILPYPAGAAFSGQLSVIGAGLKARKVLEGAPNKKIGETFEGRLYRSVPKGRNPLEIHPIFNAEKAIHRYTGEGQGGLYLGSSQRIVNSEFTGNGVSIEGLVNNQYQVRIDGLLDLTNSVVRSDLGVSLNDLVRTGGSKEWRYEITNPLGRYAEDSGYNGIIAPAAQADAGVNVILFNPDLVK